MHGVGRPGGSLCRHESGVCTRQVLTRTPRSRPRVRATVFPRQDEASGRPRLEVMGTTSEMPARRDHSSRARHPTVATVKRRVQRGGPRRGFHRSGCGTQTALEDADEAASDGG
jgi:hypothetical protein